MKARHKIMENLLPAAEHMSANIVVIISSIHLCCFVPGSNIFEGMFDFELALVRSQKKGH